MNALHQKILDACREEVAKKYDCENWGEFVQKCKGGAISFEIANTTAALLAMEKQAEFELWKLNNATWIKQDQCWLYKFYPKTELELYEIWEGQKP